MGDIPRIVGHSPFVALQVYMNKAANCVEKLPRLCAAYWHGETPTAQALAADKSMLEHEADAMKHNFRDNLPRDLRPA